jgi:hypothetical protein
MSIEIKVVYVVNVNNISGLGAMELNATFNNIAVISWRSVLLVEETGEPEKHNEQPQVKLFKFSHCERFIYIATFQPPLHINCISLC